jgi:hypothetical protein
LNLQTKGAKLYGSDWYPIAGVDKTEFMSLVYQPNTNLDDPPSSKLKSEFKLIHNICLHSIFPRKGSKNKVTDNDLMIMYHMSNQIKINLPYILLQHMISTIENGTRKITLPYGMYLTRAFRKFKVSFKGEFSSSNLGRMKILSDIPDKDQGVKRKRDLFETAENLEMLAAVITTQEDHVENVLHISTSSDKGKQVMVEDDFSDSRDLGVTLEFDSAFEDNLDSNLNKFTSILMDGFSTADNPVNTSLFSPLMLHLKQLLNLSTVQIF